MQEQELFQGYEVKNWDFSPRLYKILAASAIFNVLALLVVAQSNLLTTKGCDSPLVGGVCQVIDTLYVGGTVLTTDREYVSKPYEETELADADIIWIDQTGVDKFNYPEGYFALSNPELLVPQPISTDGTEPFPTYIPGMNNPPTTGALIDKPQVLPPTGGGVDGPLPTNPFDFKDNPTVTSGNRNKWKKPSFPKTPIRPEKSPTDELPPLKPDGDETANKDLKDDKNNPIAAVEINKEPMKKFASDVKTKVEKKEVDLSQNFKVVAEGVLTKEGKLDITPDKKTNQPKSRILAKEGNAEMVDVAEKAIAAIGDSGWLGHLRNLGVEKINFTVVQDNDNLQVIILSDMPTKEQANTVSSGLYNLMKIALAVNKNLGEDEKVLLNSAKTTVNPDNAKQFVLNFVIPKTTALEMITRKLNEKPADPTTETKPNGGTAQIKENRQNTAK